MSVISYQDSDQNTFAESNHQASADSDNPSWATLSAEATSAEEDALGLESQATTPEPAEEKQAVSYTIIYHSKATLSTPFPHQQPTGILDSHLASTCKSPSNHLKRKSASDSLSTYVSLAKKTKPPPLPHLHVTHLGRHPLQPINHLPLSYSSILPQRPTTAQAAPHLHINTASQTQQHTPFSSHDGTHTSLSSALVRQSLRPRKALPPITDNSSIEDWALVDDVLHTHIASSCILRSSPQFPAPWEPEGAVLKQAGGMCIPLMQFADLEKGSKGKARAVSGRTVPRWSNVGEFKVRLDMMYGPGDINRGLGRGPKNIQANNVESGTAPDQAALVGLYDREAAQGSASTEDEDDPEMSLGGKRRGRLENPSPQKDTLAFRHHGASGKSPEIE